MRSAPRPIAVLLGVVALLAGLPPPAAPCSCGEPATPRLAREQATVVFLGLVVSAFNREIGEGGFPRSRTFRFRVSRAWKGVSSETVDVTTATLGTACGYPFEIGEEYLVYGHTGEGPGLWTSSCTRTAHFRYAENGDLRQLSDPVWTSRKTEGPLLSDELLRASSGGNAAEVRRLVTAGHDVNGRDRRNGTTALKAAAAGGHAATVKVLLGAGADVNATRSGANALDAAIQSGQPEVVRLLLAAGARAGPYALARAAQGPIPVLEVLLAGGVPVRGEPGADALVAAAEAANLAMVQRLLSAGAKPARPSAGYSALDRATRKGSIEIVRALLDGGAEPTQMTLDEAFRSGNRELVRLVEGALRRSTGGARPGPLALLLAAQESSLPGIDLALKNGVDVNATLDGEPVLVEAVRASATATAVRRLLQAGADPNRAGRTGVTPLMAAAMGGRVDVLELLLEAGAGIEAQQRSEGHDRGTALLFAVRWDRVENVRCLLKAGAKANAPVWGILYGTLLTEAVGRGGKDVVQLLIAAGADVNARGTVGAGDWYRSPGPPPLRVAVDRGDAEMVRILLEAGAKNDEVRPK